MRVAIAVLAVLCAWGPSAAWADKLLGECEVETKLSAQLTKALDAPLSPGAALKICKFGDSTEYHLLTAPWRGKQAVCHYESIKLYPQQSPTGEMVLKTSTSDVGYSQAQYLTVASSPCPPVADERYVLSDSVSEGLFLLIWAFWERVSMHGLPGVCNAVPSEARIDRTYMQLERDLRGGMGKLSRISFMDLSAEPIGPGQFGMQVTGLRKDRQGNPESSEWYKLDVDFVGDRLCLTGVGLIVS